MALSPALRASFHRGELSCWERVVAELKGVSKEMLCVLTRLNKPIVNEGDGTIGAVNRIITIIPADPIIKGREVKGDDCAFIPCCVVVFFKRACHLAEETVWI